MTYVTLQVPPERCNVRTMRTSVATSVHVKDESKVDARFYTSFATVNLDDGAASIFFESAAKAREVRLALQKVERHLKSEGRL